MIPYFFAIVAVVFVGYYASVFVIQVHHARTLVQETIPFERHQNDATTKMLVLGDSTSVGVGASNSQDSVPGLVAEHQKMVHVENYAVSGAQTKQLLKQLQSAQHTEYDLILIQIGGNDIINFVDAKRAAVNLESVLDKLPEAKQVVVISAGNVGAATIFPWFIRPLYTARTKEYHAAFNELVISKGHTYVNLYEPPATDPFVKEPQVYLSKDGLHPSLEGYRLWFEKIKPVL